MRDTFMSLVHPEDETKEEKFVHTACYDSKQHPDCVMN